MLSALWGRSLCRHRRSRRGLRSYRWLPRLERLTDRITPACTPVFAGNVLTVTCTSANNDTVIISHDNTGNILVNGSAVAGSPTLANTKTIDLLPGTSDNDTMVIDISNGDFDKVNINADAETSFGDQLQIIGQTAGDKITFTTSTTIDTDTDGDDDITLVNSINLTLISINAGNGDDIVDAANAQINLILKGGVGNDSLIGGSGDDAIAGEADNDTLTGGQADDTMDGGAGTDRIIDSGNGNFTLEDTLLTGPGGADILNSLEEALLIDGVGSHVLDAQLFTGSASLIGNAGDDTLKGGAGHDFLSGGDGLDSFIAGNGNDTISTGAGTETVDGGAGIDRIFEQADVNFTLSDNNLTGLGSDALSSIEEAHLTGGAGANTFTIAFTGAATIDGGAGIDTIAEADNKNFTLTDTKLTGIASHTLLNIEQASLTGGVGGNTIDASGFSGPVTLAGLGGNDSLVGGKANDLVLGGDGDDTLKGGPGDDTLDGGNGTDRHADPGVGKDTLISIEETVVTGTSGNDLIDLSKDTGGVFVDAGGGNDTVIGGSGDDTIIGGDGNDSIDGGLGTDLVIAAGDVNFALTNSTLAGQGSDTLVSIEQASLTGGAGANSFDVGGFSGSGTMIGGAGIDRVVASVDANFTLTDLIVTSGAGRAASDVSRALLTLSTGGKFTLDSVLEAALTGGKSNNSFTVTGFTGEATLNGADGNDRVVSSAAGRSTLTNSSLIVTLGGDFDLENMEEANLIGGDAGDILDASQFSGRTTLDGGSGADTVTGGSGTDVLLGSNGRDRILGKGSNDTIDGGKGADVIFGGGGNDRLRGLEGNDTLFGGPGIDTLDGGPATDFCITGEVKVGCEF